MVVRPEILHHYRINANSSSVVSTGKMRCVVDEEAEIRRFAAERGLAEELKSVMASRAFRMYKWNYKRLDRSLRRQFLDLWSIEARKWIDNGAISRKYFSNFKTASKRLSDRK